MRGLSRLNSTTARFIALHFAFSSLAAALILALVWVQTARQIDRGLESMVRAEVAGLSQAWAEGGTPALARAVALRLGAPDAGDSVLLLTGPGGAVLAGNLSGWPPNAPAPGAWQEIALFRAGATRPSLVTGTSFALPNGARLLVGRDAAARGGFQATLWRALLGGLAASALFSALSGLLLSRYLARRLGTIRDTAGAVGAVGFGASGAAAGLSLRVPLAGSGDEFDRLGGTLNTMLGRIEDLVGELRLVTDSMAHDLRSPLMRMTSALEEAGAARGPGARRAALGRASSEVAQMLKTLTALLDIARAEAGMGRDQFAPVDLGRLLDEAAALYAPLAEEQGLTLVRQGAGALVEGHGPLLAQALGNLAENALRFAPAGSAVVFAALDDPPGFAVRDHGPGIAPADRERVLARFVRLDPARSGPGSGLGLSLAQAVARLHGGSLTLGDNRPGLSADVRLGPGG